MGCIPERCLYSPPSGNRIFPYPGISLISDCGLSRITSGFVNGWSSDNHRERSSLRYTAFDEKTRPALVFRRAAPENNCALLQGAKAPSCASLAGEVFPAQGHADFRCGPATEKPDHSSENKRHQDLEVATARTVSCLERLIRPRAILFGRMCVRLNRRRLRRPAVASLFRRTNPPT